MWLLPMQCITIEVWLHFSHHVQNVACEIECWNNLALAAIGEFVAARLFTSIGTWPLGYFTDSRLNSDPAM
jgi:hypothetical protein